MESDEKQEFIIMLLIENRSYSSSDKKNAYYRHLKEHYNIEKFNKRYMELLDKFMKPYALNNTEKSE